MNDVFRVKFPIENRSWLTTLFSADFRSQGKNIRNMQRQNKTRSIQANKGRNKRRHNKMMQSPVSMAC